MEELPWLFRRTHLPCLFIVKHLILEHLIAFPVSTLVGGLLVLRKRAELVLRGTRSSVLDAHDVFVLHLCRQEILPFLFRYSLAWVLQGDGLVVCLRLPSIAHKQSS